MDASPRSRGWYWVAVAMVGIGPAHGQQDLTGVAEGRVLGPLGEPMRGAEVTATIWPALDQVIARTRTDGDGMFVLGRLPLRQTKLKSHTGFHDLRYLVRYEDNADPARELALVAVPAAFVTGRLVDGEGEPVPFQWTELQERQEQGRSPGVDGDGVCDQPPGRDGGLPRRACHRR